MVLGNHSNVKCDVGSKTILKIMLFYSKDAVYYSHDDQNEKSFWNQRFNGKNIGKQSTADLNLIFCLRSIS